MCREWIAFSKDVSYHVSFRTMTAGQALITTADALSGLLSHLGDGGLAGLVPAVHMLCETETELKTKSTACLCNSET